ncbi:MAG: NAD(+) diphosphatase [Lachnospiraceae bacterium]|nr:NAD(+) diphosphatase [Lachnospiraceae bacterium]
MIQDISPHKLDNAYYPDRTPKPDDFVVVYNDRQILVKVNEEEKTMTFPKVSDVTEKDELVYLFSIDNTGFYMLSEYRQEAFSEGMSVYKKLSEAGFDFMTVRSLTSHPLEPKTHAYAAFTAMHLSEWYNRHQFCGRCGSILRRDDIERAMRCDNCGQIFYPRLNPAVIAGVRNGDSILLTRYKQGFKYNALVAGFVEVGETIEEAVAREVKEETGLSVKNIRYYKSQPWGIAGDLLAGFYCDVDGDDTIHMDETELKYAQWVKREDIELQPAQYSLTNEMMQMFRDGNA